VKIVSVSKLDQSKVNNSAWNEIGPPKQAQENQLPKMEYSNNPYTNNGQGGNGGQ
jgi:hypothetical protein